MFQLSYGKGVKYRFIEFIFFAFHMHDSSMIDISDWMGYSFARSSSIDINKSIG